MAKVTEALLDATEICRVYRSGASWTGKESTHVALRDISFRVESARTLGIVGESGSGKSTLCRLLLRLERPSSGTISYRGVAVDQLDAAQQRRFHREVQAVFQDPLSSLNPRMRVSSILDEPFSAAKMSLPRAESQDRVEGLMKLVGLDPALHRRYPAQFSGGQRQRIAIARALALEPALIIADEPVTALDVSVQAQIMNLLRDLQEARGVSYVFVSHNLSMVRFLCHDVLVLQSGRVVERGPTQAIFEDPQHEYTRTLLRATPMPDPDAPRPVIERPKPLPDLAGEVEVSRGHLLLHAEEGGRL